MKQVYVIIILLILAAIAIGLGVGLTEGSGSDSGGGPSSVTVKWVAVGNDAPGGTPLGDIMYSADGKYWYQSDTAGASFGSNGIHVAYGTSNGTSPLWVAVGDGDFGYGHIMYSPDGKVWTQTTEGASFVTKGLGVEYGTSNGTSQLWVAVGNNITGGGTSYGNVMWSDDGKNWTQTTEGASFSTNGYGVAYGTSNGTSPLWVATGHNFGGSEYGNIMYSPDGKVWTEPTSGDSFATFGNGVAYGTSNGTSPLWVAVGNGNTDFDHIMYSPDGKVWTSTTDGASFSSSGYGVAYGTSDGTSPLWVAVGQTFVGTDNGNIMYSADGKYWYKSDTTGASFSTSGRGVAYGTINGTTPLWVVTGYDSDALGRVMYSSDGKKWTSTTEGDSFANTASGVASGTSNPAFASHPGLLPWPST